MRKKLNYTVLMGKTRLIGNCLRFPFLVLFFRFLSFMFFTFLYLYAFPSFIFHPSLFSPSQIFFFWIFSQGRGKFTSYPNWLQYCSRRDHSSVIPLAKHKRCWCEVHVKKFSQIVTASVATKNDDSYH